MFSDMLVRSDRRGGKFLGCVILRGGTPNETLGNVCGGA